MQKEICIFSSWFEWPLTQKKKPINEMLFATISRRSCGNLSIYPVSANKQSFLKRLIGDTSGNTQEVAKVAMRDSCWMTNSPSPPFFLELPETLGVQALSLSRCHLICSSLIWMRPEREARKRKHFESNKVPSGSVETTLDVRLSSVSYTAQGKWIMIPCLWVT